MKCRWLFWWGACCFVWWCAGAESFGQGTVPVPDGKKKKETHLRLVCALPGDIKPSQFGEWPTFSAPLRLATTGARGEAVLFNGLLPLSVRGYTRLPDGADQIVLQELVPTSPTPTAKTKSAKPFRAPEGGFFTLLLRQPERGGVEMEILEDATAQENLPVSAGEGGPPVRAVRCLAVEPGVQVKLVCPEAGLKIETKGNQVARAENLKAGLWSVGVEGQDGGKAFQTSLEMDFSGPVQYTVIFMRDIYGRLAPYLLKDGATD